MLRVSKLADYGSVLMVQLARHRDAVLTATDLAEKTRIKLPTVSKLLKLLAKRNLLESHRGVNGGYGLARAPEEISIAEIIQAVEGKPALTECSFHAGDCALEPICEIRGNWRLISDAVYAALDSVSLAKLANPSMKITSVDVKKITGLGKVSQRGVSDDRSSGTR
ncbi:MAG: SUF system Fe-S cluster assembly regulator [Proteobacteria bacterium]|nr:SUF system Fe-S cluster assembly regulator [Pseudomonadota bacterium]